METVYNLVTRLNAKYIQVVNCIDSTWRGVVMCQNQLVNKYQYDESESILYIWIAN